MRIPGSQERIQRTTDRDAVRVVGGEGVKSDRTCERCKEGWPCSRKARWGDSVAVRCHDYRPEECLIVWDEKMTSPFDNWKEWEKRAYLKLQYIPPEGCLWIWEEQKV